jgi:ribosomal protein L21
MDGLVAVEVRPDNAVEADEVIDMVMGQEDGFKVRKPIVAQYRVVASVNQQRVVSALIVDEQKRVAG